MSNFVAGNFEDKYQTTNPISRFLVSRFLATFRQLLLEVKAQDRVLTICEVGCGEGELIKIIHEYFPEAELSALDLSANEIKKAKKNTRGIKVKYSVQNAENLRVFPDKAFDLVVCCEVLEHLNHPEQGLKELQRVARWALVSVPIEPLWRILNLCRGKYWSDLGNTPGHLNHWSPWGFKRFIRTRSRADIIKEYLVFPWQMYVLRFDHKQSQEKQGLLSGFLRRQRYTQTKQYIPARSVVVDIGCGSGEFAQYLPKGTTYFGIDAQKQWQGQRKDLFVVKVGQPLPKPIQRAKASVVTALAILEHLKKPEQLFKQAARILPTGGLFIATTPHPSGRHLHDWGAQVGVFSNEASEEHETFLNEEELMRYAHKTGFDVIVSKRFLWGFNQVLVGKKR